MISKEAVKAAVSVEEYMESQGFELRHEGTSLRGPCPFCGGSESATKFVVDDDLWHCKACGKGGDVITLHAQYTEKPFSQAVEDLGRLFQVGDGGLSMADLEEKRLNREAKNTSRCEDIELARFKAQKAWSRLQTRSEAGERYLAERGVPGTLSEVRFGLHSVCLPIYDFTGTIVNVVGRRFTGSGPKVLGMSDACSLGTFGNYSEFSNRECDIVLVEGFFDYLTAKQMDGKAPLVVLGVHGVSNLPKIVAGLASVKQMRTCMIIPQNDEAAETAVNKAIEILHNWGISDCMINIRRVPPQFNDLNDMHLGHGELQ